MGIRGLTTFIAENGHLFFTPAYLSKTFLVIDGNCVLCQLYQTRCNRDSAFGGDYDEFYTVVITFFKTLKKCGIMPIVVLDGGHESKKMETLKHRWDEKLKLLKLQFWSPGFSNTKFFPIFLYAVFTDALRFLNIQTIKTHFEADREIAIIAKNYDCPVLSNDSDFYIFNVQYIPFDTINLEPIKTESGFVLECKMFKTNNFLNQFPGLQMDHLPVMAAVLGSDFNDSRVFDKLFEHISLKKYNHSSSTQKKMKGFLNWIRGYSPAMSVTIILNIIPKRYHTTVVKAFKDLNEIYNTDMDLPYDVPLTVDLKFFQPYLKYEIPSNIIYDMKIFNIYFTSLQIEAPNEESCHILSYPIISEIYGSLELEKPLKITIRSLYQIKEQFLAPTTLGLENCLNLSDNDLLAIETFRGLEIFFISLIYFMRQLHLPDEYFHSLILGMIAVQAKSRVGLCTVKKVADKDLTKFLKVLKPYGKTQRNERNNYDIKTVHVLNTFQSLIFHLNILTMVTKTSYKPLKINEIYSGTLIYNLVKLFHNKGSIFNFIINWIPCLSLKELYSSINGIFYPHCVHVPSINIQTECLPQKNNINHSDPDISVRSYSPPPELNVPLSRKIKKTRKSLPLKGDVKKKNRNANINNNLLVQANRKISRKKKSSITLYPEDILYDDVFNDDEIICKNDIVNLCNDQDESDYDDCCNKFSVLHFM